jgi:hypothetical protein
VYNLRYADFLQTYQIATSISINVYEKSELNLENSFWYYHENPLLIILEARKSYQTPLKNYEKIFLNYCMYVSTGNFYNTETYAYLKKEM